MSSISSNIGCTAETLRKWVRQAGCAQGTRGDTSSSERERLKELERENCELKRANEILRKASAYFARAERDRQILCAARIDGVVYQRPQGWV